MILISRKIKTALIGLILITGLTGFLGAQEAAQPAPDSLVVTHIDMKIFLRMDNGPDSTIIAQVDPFFGPEKYMEKWGRLFWAEVTSGGLYRIPYYTHVERSGNYSIFYTESQGIQGQEGFIVDIKKPGLYFMGSFEVKDGSMVKVASPSELEVMMMVLPRVKNQSQKRMVEARIQELRNAR